MLSLGFGLATLYPWSRPEVVAAHPSLQHKAIYLNAPFFLLRTAAALGLWILFSSLLRRHSRMQDRDGDPAHTQASRRLATAFLILFGATFTLASFDWIMSLEPEWSSSIFPLYIFAGLFLGGLAAMTVLTIGLREWQLPSERGSPRGSTKWRVPLLHRMGVFHLAGVTGHHLYELSRALCAAAAFWTFIGFSQYMLIYYANLPEEVVYYTRRIQGAGPLLLLNLLLNGALPLLLLIPVAARRSPARLIGVCAVVLAGRWLDVYLLILPALGSPLSLGLPELFIFAGCGGLFLLAFLRCFRSAAPVPQKDPYLEESLHLHV
jgi:hypothetical protein